MSQEALQRFTEGTSFEGDASRIQDLGERVLERLLHPPDPAVATGLAACALRFVHAGWGIYGFGLRRIQDSWIGDEPVDDETVVTLTVDHAWLMTDLRNRSTTHRRHRRRRQWQPERRRHEARWRKAERSCSRVTAPSRRPASRSRSASTASAAGRNS